MNNFAEIKLKQKGGKRILLPPLEEAFEEKPKKAFEISEVQTSNKKFDGLSRRKNDENLKNFLNTTDKEGDNIVPFYTSWEIRKRKRAAEKNETEEPEEKDSISLDFMTYSD